MSKSLYELTGEWDYVYRQLEDEEADAAEIIATCGLIEEEMTDKADSYGKVIRMLELEAQDAKADASRLAARAKTAENRAAALKQALMETMKVTGMGALKTPHFSYRISPTPAAVRITDLDAVWETYHKEQPRDLSQIDKAKLAEDIKAGVYVEGAELVRGECLRMR